MNDAAFLLGGGKYRGRSIRGLSIGELSSAGDMHRQANVCYGCVWDAKVMHHFLLSPQPTSRVFRTVERLLTVLL